MQNAKAVVLSSAVPCLPSLEVSRHGKDLRRARGFMTAFKDTLIFLLLICLKSVIKLRKHKWTCLKKCRNLFRFCFLQRPLETWGIIYSTDS